ncbi:MAG: VOC family protein [Actinobacteria bacterium]|nr:VOC family protein [Actinomycetota bacterium]
MTAPLDHLVLGVPDFAEGLEHVTRVTGARPIDGGHHPGQGTRNAVLRLGRECYLEVLGPDRDQPRPAERLRFGLDDLDQPRLVAWCVPATDLDARVERARALGFAPTGVVAMSRQVPGGAPLRWRVAGLGLGPRGRGLGGVVPFLIDWGQSPHPAHGAPDLVQLRRFSVLHPDPLLAERVLSSLGFRPAIKQAVRPGLEAILDTPEGQVTIS